MFKKIFVVALCLLALVLLLNSCDASSSELDHSVIVPAGIGVSQNRAVSFLDSTGKELSDNTPAGLRVTIEPMWNSPVADESIAYGNFANATSVPSSSKAKYKDFEGSQAAVNLGWISQGFWKISVVAYDSWNEGSSSVAGSEIYLGESVICFTTSNNAGVITLEEKQVACTVDLSAGIKVPALSNDSSKHYIIVWINDSVQYLTATKNVTTVTKEDVEYKTTLDYYFDGSVGAHTGSNYYSVQFCEVKGAADYNDNKPVNDEEDLIIGGMSGVFFAKGNVTLSGSLNPAEFVNSSIIINSDSMKITLACNDSNVISSKSAALNTAYTFTVSDASKNMANLVWNFDGYEFSAATDNSKFKAETVSVDATTGVATMALTVKVPGNHTLSCVATGKESDMKADQKIKFTVLP